MNTLFLENTSFIIYNRNEYHSDVFNNIEDITFQNNHQSIHWLNTYGVNHSNAFKYIIENSYLDDFLLKLISNDKHSNKVLELDGVLFIAIKILKTDTISFETEQIFFVMTPNYLWSIQEKPGDYFEWIRERIKKNKGIVRSKKTDYLLFLLFESIIDNYEESYDAISSSMKTLLQTLDIKPTPDFTYTVEKEKNVIITFKRAAVGLRDVISKFEKIEEQEINKKYFSELNTQINNLIHQIDLDLQELESKINLIFSIQGHRLNEVMKTLTIFSVIFIPLTFLAGIYGMNFKNIPELQTENGYYILLGIMILMTLVSVYYFKRKKWF